MGKLGHGIEAEHPARPLDRMGRTEDLGEQLQILWMLLQRQQTFLDDRQVLGGFFEKGLLKLCEFVAHPKPRCS